MPRRPALTQRLAVEDFQSFYWLKEELLVFCRAHGLSTTGAKKDLTWRVAQFLKGGQVEARPPRRATPKATGPMPLTFSRETVIGVGWRCSQPLRFFFERELGPRFHFDSVMRDFIRDGAGRTLNEAIQAWEAGQQTGRVAKAIAPQFEYNQHIRDYFQAHPSATLREAIAAWKKKRAQRRG